MNSTPKILHLITDLAPGGAEFMLCNLLEGMAGNGLRHTIVTTAMQNDEGMVARAHNAGATVLELKSGAMLKPKTLRRLARVIRDENPDVVQTWMHKADLAGSLACIRHRAKVVWGIHSLEPHAALYMKPLPLWGFKKMLALAARFFTHSIISCSEAAIESHARAGYPRKKMHWIPNGVDTRRFKPNQNARAALRAELGIPNEAPVIGFVGRSVPEKDLPTFLKAAAIVQQRRPDLHLVLCGPKISGDDQTLAQAISALPKPGQLHLLAYRKDVENVFPAFDLFAMTSVSEAFPMVLLEAMASGVPCVTTDVGDCALIVENPAAVAPAGNPTAVAGCWNHFLSLGAPKLAALGEKLRQRVEERFSVAASVREYTRHYRILSGLPDEHTANDSLRPAPAHP